MPLADTRGSARTTMAVDITIPALGESLNEATILRWLKAAGEAVELDEVVVEIETDKATMELVAPETGVLSEILKGEGEKVEIGETIGRVTPDGAARAAPDAAPRPSAASAAPTRPASPQPPPVSAPLSPAVRRLVEEHTLKPAELTATGPGGGLAQGDALPQTQAPAPGPP